MSEPPNLTLETARIAVIGLGYVGLPLAVELGKRYPTLGFDSDAARVAELNSGHDRTLEVGQEALAAAKMASFSFQASDLADRNVFIVCVPTPVDDHKQPDLGPLQQASRLVGENIGRGGIVIYESTVYPGATEEDCVPIIESASGLTFNVDFFAGYSPERINPGDPGRRITDIVKVTSGSTPAAAEFVDSLYASFVSAGTYRAPSIKVAEAAKVIENIQRDLNIALVNELAIIFARLGIDTHDVLDAAATKWNFQRFRPGLVGGHCVGVDPYYLTHKAQSAGYHPEIILSGRRINDGMGAYAAQQLVKAMIGKRIQVDGARCLVIGLAFKENCGDLRNTGVAKLVAELRSFNVEVDVWDPLVDGAAAKRDYDIAPVDNPQSATYDAIVLAVAHDRFRKLKPAAIRRFGKTPHVVFDLTQSLPTGASDLRL